MSEIKSKEIQIVSVDSLISYPKNMNKHTPNQIDRLIELIRYQGFRDPLIVQAGTNVVVAGNGRLEAAKKMGLREVPVTYQEFDSEAQLYSFVVSHNAINSSNWGGGLDLAMINDESLKLDDLDADMLGIKEFSIAPLQKFEMEDELREDMNKKFILEIIFPNDMERMDIHDDLVSRGYIVKIKDK